MPYPKTFTHRDDRNQKVVIANAEQEAELPAEYLPDGGASVAQSGDVLAEREKLERDRTEFAELVAASGKDASKQMQDLEEGRAKLQQDRDELTKGYKASMEKLEADRAKLDEDIRLFDEKKAGEQSTDAPEAGVGEASDTPTEQPPAVPTRRTRAPKV